MQSRSAISGVGMTSLTSATEQGIAVVNIPDLWTAHDGCQPLCRCFWRLTARVVNHASPTFAPTRGHRVLPTQSEHSMGRLSAYWVYGSIGSAMAQRAKGFELHVIAYDPYISDEEFAERVVEG